MLDVGSVGHGSGLYTLTTKNWGIWVIFDRSKAKQVLVSKKNVGFVSGFFA